MFLWSFSVWISKSTGFPLISHSSRLQTPLLPAFSIIIHCRYWYIITVCFCAGGVSSKLWISFRSDSALQKFNAGWRFYLLAFEVTNLMWDDVIAGFWHETQRKWVCVWMWIQWIRRQIYLQRFKVEVKVHYTQTCGSEQECWKAMIYIFHLDSLKKYEFNEFQR